MSTTTGSKALRINGKMVAAASLFLIAGVAAPRTVSEVRGDFDGDGKPDRAAIEATDLGWRLVVDVRGRRTGLGNPPGAPSGFYLKPVGAGRSRRPRGRHAACH